MVLNNEITTKMTAWIVNDKEPLLLSLTNYLMSDKLWSGPGLDPLPSVYFPLENSIFAYSKGKMCFSMKGN